MTPPVPASFRCERRTYWLGPAFAVVPFAGGIAGLALGYRYFGYAGLILGGTCPLGRMREGSSVDMRGHRGALVFTGSRPA